MPPPPTLSSLYKPSSLVSIPIPNHSSCSSTLLEKFPEPERDWAFGNPSRRMLVHHTGNTQDGICSRNNDSICNSDDGTPNSCFISASADSIGGIPCSVSSTRSSSPYEYADMNSGVKRGRSVTAGLSNKELSCEQDNSKAICQYHPIYRRSKSMQKNKQRLFDNDARDSDKFPLIKSSTGYMYNLDFKQKDCGNADGISNIEGFNDTFYMGYTATPTAYSQLESAATTAADTIALKASKTRASAAGASIFHRPKRTCNSKQTSGMARATQKHLNIDEEQNSAKRQVPAIDDLSSARGTCKIDVLREISNTSSGNCFNDASASKKTLRTVLKKTLTRRTRNPKNDKKTLQWNSQTAPFTNGETDAASSTKEASKSGIVNAAGNTQTHMNRSSIQSDQTLAQFDGDCNYGSLERHAEALVNPTCNNSNSQNNVLRFGEPSVYKTTRRRRRSRLASAIAMEITCDFSTALSNTNSTDLLPDDSSVAVSSNILKCISTNGAEHRTNLSTNGRSRGSGVKEKSVMTKTGKPNRERQLVSPSSSIMPGSNESSHISKSSSNHCDTGPQKSRITKPNSAEASVFGVDINDDIGYRSYNTLHKRVRESAARKKQRHRKTPKHASNADAASDRRISNANNYATITRMNVSSNNRTDCANIGYMDDNKATAGDTIEKISKSPSDFGTAVKAVSEASPIIETVNPYTQPRRRRARNNILSSRSFDNLKSSVDASEQCLTTGRRPYKRRKEKQEAFGIRWQRNRQDPTEKVIPIKNNVIEAQWNGEICDTLNWNKTTSASKRHEKEEETTGNGCKGYAIADPNSLCDYVVGKHMDTPKQSTELLTPGKKCEIEKMPQRPFSNNMMSTDQTFNKYSADAQFLNSGLSDEVAAASTTQHIGVCDWRHADRGDAPERISSADISNAITRYYDNWANRCNGDTDNLCSVELPQNDNIVYPIEPRRHPLYKRKKTRRFAYGGKTQFRLDRGFKHKDDEEHFESCILGLTKRTPADIDVPPTLNMGNLLNQMVKMCLDNQHKNTATNATANGFLPYDSIGSHKYVISKVTAARRCGYSKGIRHNQLLHNYKNNATDYLSCATNISASRKCKYNCGNSRNSRNKRSKHMKCRRNRCLRTGKCAKRCRSPKSNKITDVMEEYTTNGSNTACISYNGVESELNLITGTTGIDNSASDLYQSSAKGQASVCATQNSPNIQEHGSSRITIEGFTSLDAASYPYNGLLFVANGDDQNPHTTPLKQKENRFRNRTLPAGFYKSDKLRYSQLTPSTCNSSIGRYATITPSPTKISDTPQRCLTANSYNVSYLSPTKNFHYGEGLHNCKGYEGGSFLGGSPPLPFISSASAVDLSCIL